MPSTLSKTRKQIAKKRNGEVNALHAKSRDSLRLHKAGVRDQRLEKLASARGKKEQPVVDRVAFFQQGLRDNDGAAVEMSKIQDLIKTHVNQYSEEFDTVKKQRRPGRPASAREDLLKMKIDALEAEHKNGFLMPDISTSEGAELLSRWEGSWAFLTTLPWVRVTSGGQIRKAEVPSRGLN